MNLYKNILVAVDLHPHYDDHTIESAVAFSKEMGAQLTILHAVEPIHAYGAAQGYEIILEVEEKIMREAQKSLNTLGEKFGIPVEKQLIIKGPSKTIILENAKKLNMDLIIVGSHSRHGLHLFFGTTADGVTHNAHCDVLSIRGK